MASFFLKRKRAASGNNKVGIKYLVSRRTALIAVVVAVIAASVLANFLLIRKVEHHKKIIIAQKKALVRATEPIDTTSEVAGHWYGLCPKGVIHCIEDFKRIVMSDPLLAQHFADFDWENASMGKLNEPTWTHVTYRKDGKIRMMNRPIRLPKGDGFITDGKRWVRTYCGNDFVLAGDTERNEDSTYSDTKVSSSTTRNGKPGDDAIPEPSTFLLVATGLIGLGIASMIRRRSRACR